MQRPFWALWFLALAGCGSQELATPTEPLRLIQASPPPAYLGESYTYAFAAEGGVRPYAFSLEGRLPQGLGFQGGRLTGTPREKGEFPLILTVEDGAKNSRAQRITLRVQDPPPPRLNLVLPPGPVEGPFLVLGRLEVREALGLQLDLPLGRFQADLDTLRAATPIHLVRLDPERNLLQLDLAFPRPIKDQEAFRLFLLPPGPETPRLAPKAVVYDREGKPTGQALERGRAFSLLLELARTFGQKGQGLPGDLNGDGQVDEKDLKVLEEGYFKAPAESPPRPPDDTQTE